ncbi:MAG TPA: hypothetical protein VK528_01980 [Flavobacterium sp.]|nr:hypothetical protein [Flavobacterium sp.]
MKSIEERRETSKVGLETFFLDIQNNFYDRISDEAIKAFLEKINDAKNRKIEEQNEEYFAYTKTMEIFFLEQELRAIAEMKILYAYKNFEIKLKFLLGAAYGIIVSKIFKWETIVEFLKEKKINIVDVKANQEISELRNVNNVLKHTDSLHEDNRTNNIKEFKKLKEIRYEDLLTFYKRIEKAPINFISSLSSHIYKDLYVFDEQRLDSEAEKLALRMTEDEATIFIQKFKEKY